METQAVFEATRPGFIRPWIVDVYELLQAAMKRLEAKLALQKAGIAMLEDAVKFHPECPHCVQALNTMAKLRREATLIG
jgi:hypothetical protein